MEVDPLKIPDKYTSTGYHRLHAIFQATKREILYSSGILQEKFQEGRSEGNDCFRCNGEEHDRFHQGWSR